jgi:hypothetical protein
MNGKLFNFIAVAAVLLMCGQVRAQDPVKPARPMEPPKRPTAEQMAESRTREMDTLLNLDAKQYKKIYKMNLKEAKEKVAWMESKSESSNSNGMSEMPMGGGMGQGGPGMGGGGMGQGGGMPPMGGGMGQGGPGMEVRMGQGSPRMQKDDEETIEKEKAKKAKQLKKILTQEQFQIWQKDEAARESKEFWKAQNDRSDSTVTF